MRKRVLIDKKTGADSVQQIFTKGSIVADGDLGTDEIEFFHVGNNDQDLTTAYDTNEQVMKLTSTRPGTAIPFPSHLKISKPTTTNPVGLYLIEE